MPTPKTDNRATRAQLETFMRQLSDDLRPIIQGAVQDIRNRREQEAEQLRREALMKGLRRLFPRSL